MTSADTYFLDTSFLIAHRNLKDENHAQAVACFEELQQSSPHLKLVLTDYIFEELATLLVVRLNKAKAVEICHAVHNDPIIRLFAVGRSLFNEAWELFQKTIDKDWSFTDCTSFVTMQHLGLERGLSFDHHFKQSGFLILP